MKSMMERIQRMHETMMEGAPDKAVSPIDRLEAFGQGMSARGAAIEKVAAAAKPLYASLDNSQKRRFGLLGRKLFMTGHGHHGHGMMHEGMMGGMGMTGRRPERLEWMENHHHDMDDHDDGNSDD